MTHLRKLEKWLVFRQVVWQRMIAEMPPRRKLDLEKIHASLNTTCPHCGASIEPKDYTRVDWEHLECPSCG